MFVCVCVCVWGGGGPYSHLGAAIESILSIS